MVEECATEASGRGRNGKEGEEEGRGTYAQAGEGTRRKCVGSFRKRKKRERERERKGRGHEEGTLRGDVFVSERIISEGEVV